jgi:hypothetical protein
MTQQNDPDATLSPREAADAIISAVERGLGAG